MSPTIIVSLAISPFKSVNICLIYCSAPMLGRYVFAIVISSSWIDSLIAMQCHSLFYCNSLYFKVYFI